MSNGSALGEAISRSPRIVSRARAELRLVALAMLAGAVVLTWPLASHLGGALPSDLADPLLNTFTLAWDADRLAHGLNGLWDAPFFFPLRDTLAFSEHLLGVALFTAPIQWLSGNAVLAYNLAFIGAYAVAGLGAYLLAHALWGSRTAAWVAALAFAAAPHRAMHVSHLQVLMSGWLALALWGLHRYFSSGARKHLVVFAASFLLLSLSCGYLMFFGAVPVGLVALSGLLHRRCDGVRGSVRRALAEVAVAGLVILLCLVPVALAYGRVRQATGLRRSVEEMAAFSARAADFGSIPPTLRAWAALLPVGEPERMLFPGLAVSLLALAAVVGALFRVARRGRIDASAATVALYTTILGASIWLSFGPRLPGLYGSALTIVPGFDGLRVPARFIVIVSLALAVLAGRGAASLAARLPHRAAAVFSVFAGVVLVAEGYAGPMPLAAFDPHQHDRGALNAWLRSAPPGAVLEFPAAGPGFAPFTVTYQFNTLFHRHPVVNGYSGTGYGLQDFLADSASPLLRAFEVRDALHGLRRLGVRYLVLHRALFEEWWRFSAAPIIEAVDASVSEVAGRAQFGEAIVWALPDADPEGDAEGEMAGRRLAPADFQATASHAPAEVGLALDGRVDTKWSTGGPKQGSEWFQLSFTRPTNVCSLQMGFGRRGYGERPHALVIESEGADGSRTILFHGSLVSQLVVGIAAGRQGATILLPENRTKVLRLRQTGSGGRNAWAIAELEIRERQ